MDEKQSDRLKTEKDSLIRAWMKLQDQVEGLNEQIYSLSCEIERLNLKIAETLEQEKIESAKKKASPPTSDKKKGTA